MAPHGVFGAALAAVLALGVLAPVVGARETTESGPGYAVAMEFRRAIERHYPEYFLGPPISHPEYRGDTLTQYFARGRLEMAGRSSLGPVGAIKLADLGAYLAEAAGASARAEFLSVPPEGAGVHFPETEHSMSGKFLEEWRLRGGMALLGPPISESYYAGPLEVQWFARGRLELAQGAGFDVTASAADVGREYLSYSRKLRDRAELFVPMAEVQADPERGVDAPILYYHEVPDGVLFERQLRGLMEAGFTPIPLARLVRVIAHGGTLPPKPIVITLDDGLFSQFRAALPVLVALRVPATFFVMPGFHEKRPGHLTVEEIRLAAEAGMSVESHTLNHANLPGLLSANLGAARAEVVLSRAVLAAYGGGEILAYPYGASTPQVEQLAADAGYAAACVTRLGRVHLRKDLFRLSRIGANASATAEVVLAALARAAEADRRRLAAAS